MTQTTIQPGQVTRPFQLLAAWLAGLILTNGSFLGAASIMESPSWAAGTLVVAAIANTPLFLACLFLLLTKFRAEMQEDQYYTTYLERRYSQQTQQIEFAEVSPVMEIVSDVPAPTSRRARVSRVASSSVVSSTVIAVNDLISGYKDIVKSMEASGYHIDRYFGSTSEKGEKPDNFIISFGMEVNIKAIQSAIIASKYKNLTGIAFSQSKTSFNNLYIIFFLFDSTCIK